MEFTLSNPEKTTDALKKGGCAAVFLLNTEGNPIFRLSEIKLADKPFNGRGILRPALDYISLNYNKDIKLSAVSALCDVSTGYFSRLFTKTVGINFSAYLTNMRLSSAKSLLKTTDRTVVSIALDSGFVDCGYFNKLFKKHVGLTPLQYRGR